MNNKKKAFVILTPGFAASENDTTCLPMQQELVRTISTLYTDLHVIIISFQYPYYEKCYSWFKATVISFNGKNKGGVPRLLLRRKIKRVLDKLHEEKQIIGLLSFWLNECAAVGKAFGEKNNIPHYCWLLGQDARQENKYPKRLCVQANELIALSDFLQEEFEKNHSIRPFTVIHPGVGIKCSGEVSKEIDLVGVGSLISLKQFNIFVEVVAELKKRFPALKAVLIGDGPERKRIQKSIEELKVQQNITVMGELPYPEVLRLMRRARILLHPSSYEGFSGVCLEALSMGAHVISFCRAMNRDIEQWHIVHTREEMIKKATALLESQATVYNRIILQPMDETAKKIMELFSIEKSFSNFS
jgi:glycosyltransferase involved in cell wall biosynthesis